MRNWNDLILCSSCDKTKTNFISIYKNGTLIFSMAFFRELEKNNEYKYVKVYYSPSNTSIVFDFFENYEEGALKISRKQTKNGFERCRSISISSLLTLLNNPAFFCKRYIPILENIPNLGKKWVIYLNKPAETKHD